MSAAALPWLLLAGAAIAGAWWAHRQGQRVRALRYAKTALEHELEAATVVGEQLGRELARAQAAGQPHLRAVLSADEEAQANSAPCADCGAKVLEFHRPGCSKIAGLVFER